MQQKQVSLDFYLKNKTSMETLFSCTLFRSPYSIIPELIINQQGGQRSHCSVKPWPLSPLISQNGDGKHVMLPSGKLLHNIWLLYG